MVQTPPSEADSHLTSQDTCRFIEGDGVYKRLSLVPPYSKLHLYKIHLAEKHFIFFEDIFSHTLTILR
jgi:hypothetical protein